jgi:hypothetical protein
MSLRLHHSPKVKQHPERGQVLLDGRLGETLQQLLDKGRDVNGLHPRGIVNVATFTPILPRRRGVARRAKP